MSCTLAGEVVILSIDKGTYYGLNEVGARVWDLIQEPRTITQLRDILVSEYEVDTTRCQQELELLIEQLEVKQLVEVTR